MEMLTKREARRFLLRKHGLLGAYRFSGKAGALAFLRQAGCIQFDPIDVCGRSPDLTFHARVKGFSRRQLWELLYRDRKAVDYFDKNLSIIPVEDWPYFARERAAHLDSERSRERLRAVRPQILAEIARRGPLCAGDFEIAEKVDWYWSSTSIARAALEHLYFTGELAIHHKKGNLKYYDLAENCIPLFLLTQPDPLPEDHAHRKWRVRRRIGAVGLLWDRGSDAWLGIPGLQAKERSAIFAELTEEEKLLPLEVEGLRLYCLAEDRALLDSIRSGDRFRPRCELIAPLDSLLWDRRLIEALFGFSYRWEIYTPQEKRKYGYYVLPVLHGDVFMGRAEPVFDRTAGVLTVKNYYPEPGVPQDPAALDGALRRLEEFLRRE